MFKFDAIDAMQQQCLQWKRQGLTIALVPTMGALHQGHLSLIEQVRAKADKVICSIFVNPTQFGANEDLGNYPQTLKSDLQGCEQNGCDAVFLPSADNIYADNKSCWVDEQSLSLNYCGGDRPGHFRGVCTVVAKLFNICLPDFAIFGEKDFQQLQVLRRMQRDLNFPIEILAAPIVREKSGLAMSSRNSYLSEEEKEAAANIYRSIIEVQQQVKQTPSEATCQSQPLLKSAQERIEKAGGEIDYIRICDCENMLEQTELRADCEYRLLVAARFGKARLIDNIRLIRG